MLSPALSAKQRLRGPSVLERRQEEERAALEAVRPRPAVLQVQQPAVLVATAATEASGGKGMKTGFVLARAVCPAHTKKITIIVQSTH